MFILDTNVVSAMMGSVPVPQVGAWVAAQRPGELFTTTLSQAEILAGIAVLPEGRRRDRLAVEARAVFEQDFAGQVLPFDQAAARAYAALFARRRERGRPAGLMDVMIGAVAVARGARLVTRNVADFVVPGLEVINPWGLGAG